MVTSWHDMPTGSRTATLEALRRYELPDRALPLCPERLPFEGMPADLMERVVERAVSTPERRGRLTDAVREVLGTAGSNGGPHVVIESHIDLTYLDDDLAGGLVAAGFEPDDFALMEPPQYVRHFTQQFVCTTRDRAAAVHEILATANATAIRLIDEHPVASGYVETEVYRSEYSSRYQAMELPLAALDQFPAEQLRFTMRAVPRSAAEAAITGMPLQARRAADIHAKIPGRFPERSWHTAADLIQERRAMRPGAEQALVDRLVDAGFYEIVSQAGNFLFSAHFADMTEANQAFHALDAFATRAGGLTGLVREGCSGLWRKPSVSHGETILAEVPPLLSSSWETIRIRDLASSGA